MTGAPPPFNAVLLAAGEGSRLGRVPKSLLYLEGITLIERQVLALLKAGADKIIIVTGYFYLEIEAEINKLLAKIYNQSSNIQVPLLNVNKNQSGYIKNKITVVRHPTPEKGQQSSVLLGLRALSNTNDLKPILIALVDQPLMRDTDYQLCVAAFLQRPAGCSIAFPVIDGQRGNPVVFSKDIIENILESGQTCREYIDRHRDQTHRFVTDNDHFIMDIDEEQDRVRFEQRTGLTLGLAPATSETEPMEDRRGNQSGEQNESAT